MELGSHGTETNGINIDADKIGNSELKGISAQQSDQIPVEELNAQGNGENLSNPEGWHTSLSRDLNCAPSEVAEVIDTKNNLQDECLTVNEQGPGFDDMIIVDDGVVTAAILPEKGVEASLAEPIEASQSTHLSSLVMSEVIAESKDALKLEGGICSGETNVEAERKGTEGENLNDVDLPLAKDKGTEGITSTFVSSSEAQPMVVDEDGQLAQKQNARDLIGGEDRSIPDVVTDNAQNVIPVAESNELTEQDIQSIKGKKVKKKFGKKNYSGDVVDYDPETKWFKVIYEDGDEEDLELWEVKEILISSVSTTKKRARTEDEEQKNAKKPKKARAGSAARKANKSRAKSSSKSPKQSKKFDTTKNSKEKPVVPNAEVKAAEAGVTESGNNTESLSSGDDVLIGRHVKKDFDGRFYDGVVLKFDKKTQYYKVKYEDGDQEELELHELQPILVQENQITEIAEEKPAQV